MNNLYKKFYSTFYRKTGGFIPSGPPYQNMYPGDFFQIRNGEIVILGNIFRAGITDREDARFDYGMKLNSGNWNFNEGVSKPYSGRGGGHGALEGTFEFSRQILSFASLGSFLFHAKDPESVKIINWNELQQQLIIKLTQTFFSFRELYVVTESVTASHWTLAVAGAEKAELEMATEVENFGLVDIFSHQSSKTIQSKDIEFYHKDQNRKPVFFKAKKLVVQEEKTEVFISELIAQRENRDEWAGGFYEYDFHYEHSYTAPVTGKAFINILDLLQAGELNPNTALLYFRWADADLDDVEKLFQNYGN